MVSEQQNTLFRVCFFSVASFTMPTSTTVSEGGSAVMVCTQMMTTPEAAVLSKEVVVTLSTIDGSGTYKVQALLAGVCNYSITT